MKTINLTLTENEAIAILTTAEDRAQRARQNITALKSSNEIRAAQAREIFWSGIANRIREEMNLWTH